MFWYWFTACTMYTVKWNKHGYTRHLIQLVRSTTEKDPAPLFSFSLLKNWWINIKKKCSHFVWECQQNENVRRAESTKQSSKWNKSCIQLVSLLRLKVHHHHQNHNGMILYQCTARGLQFVRFLTAFSITVREHDWHEHICSQMSQHACCPVPVLCTVLDSLSERKGLSNWSLLHSVDFKKSLTSWSTYLNCCPWYIKIVHECCPFRPTCPVFCKKSTALFGGPYPITLGHEATFTPIPNAVVATTTRNRLSLVKFLKAVFFFSSNVSEWYNSISSSILGC